MLIDIHVHLAANTPGCGILSNRLQRTFGFRFLRWWFNMNGSDADMQRRLADVLADTLRQAPELDAAVVLAMDAVHDDAGQLDLPNTHLHVTNDYVMGLVRQYPKMLFGCSVHPYRKDALAELDRCLRAGAVLMKWLPITQNINPADPRCFPIYEMMAHHRLPLLCHTGWERMLINVNPLVADPMRLLPAIHRSVTVIAAHCGTRSFYGETDFLPGFIRLAREHANFYGDTAGLNLPTRWYAYDRLLRDDRIRAKLIHASDWPVSPWPPPRLGAGPFRRLLFERNWLRRDIEIKRRLGFDDAYFHRGATLLRMRA